MIMVRIVMICGWVVLAAEWCTVNWLHHIQLVPLICNSKFSARFPLYSELRTNSNMLETREGAAVLHVISQRAFNSPAVHGASMQRITTFRRHGMPVALCAKNRALETF